jgi:predicted  nucleic acid-binding Zn-ribbon protein
MIKSYKEFISEKFIPDKNADPEVASAININNKNEDDVKEYNSKKNTLLNIYKTYKDEKDLLLKLTTAKFINKTTNIKNLKFNNPLLGLLATISDKNRKVIDIEKQIDGWKDNIKDQQQNISNNPSNKEGSTDQINLLNDQIKTKTDEINALKLDITKSQQYINKELDRLTKTVKDTNKKITQSTIQ